MIARASAAALRVTVIAIVVALSLFAGACGGDVTVGSFPDGGTDATDAGAGND